MEEIFSGQSVNNVENRKKCFNYLYGESFRTKVTYLAYKFLCQFTVCMKFRNVNKKCTSPNNQPTLWNRNLPENLTLAHIVKKFPSFHRTRRFVAMFTNTGYLLLKLKVKLSLCFNWVPRHEGVLGVEVSLHSFFDLGTRCRWVVSFTPRLFYPQGKSPWYPLDRRLGGPQSRSGRGCEEKNSQPLRESNPRHRSSSP
jgi:hypothetical protein